MSVGTTVEIISGGGSYKPNPSPAHGNPSSEDTVEGSPPDAPTSPGTSPGTSQPGTQHPPQGGAQGKKYIVQRGDTLWRLSQRFGVSLDDLIKANNLSNPDALHIGQELIIPR